MRNLRLHAFSRLRSQWGELGFAGTAAQRAPSRSRGGVIPSWRSQLSAGRFLLLAPSCFLACNSYCGKSETLLGASRGPSFCPLLCSRPYTRVTLLSLLCFFFSLVVSLCSWSWWVQTFILGKICYLEFSLEVLCRWCLSLQLFMLNSVPMLWACVPVGRPWVPAATLPTATELGHSSRH